MKDYYTILDLLPNATDEEIRVQYRQLVRIYHPDRFSNSTDKTYAERKLMEINEAYYALLAPERTGKGVNRRLAHSDQRFPLISSTPGSVMILLSVLFFGVFLGRSDYGQPLNGNPATQEISLWGRLVAIWPPSLSAQPSLPNGPVQPIHDWLSFSVFENYHNVIYVIGEDGQQQMSLPVAGRYPVWAPTRETIAFLSPGSSGEQIYTARSARPLDGQPQARKGNAETKSELLQITDDGEAKDGLTWSPDGLKLAYLATSSEEFNAPVTSNSVVKLIDLPSNETISLTSQRFGIARHITWLDDQTLLVDIETEDDTRIYRVGLDGQAVVPFTFFASRHPSVSPSGQRIVVASDEGLFSMLQTGEDLVQLTNQPAWSPVWSENGAQVAYLTTSSPLIDVAGQALSPENLRAKAELWIIDADGQNARKITDSGCLDFAWSGDGETLGYVTGTLQTQPPTLYLWTVKEGAAPELVAEISEPHISWGRGS